MHRPIYFRYDRTLTMGNGYWMALTPEQRNHVISEHIGKAVSILSQCGIGLPDVVSIDEMVEGSFKAFEAYVLQGIEKPDPDHWRAFFREFVIACARHSFITPKGMTIDGHVSFTKDPTTENGDGHYAGTN